jgi:DNA-binding transcriptional LysR family regulator
MRFDILGLQAFLAIAERGSFVAAAAHLNLSQTALSHRLRKLEDELGTRLLARTTRQVSLTPAGIDLLPKARHLIDDHGAAYAGMRRQARRAEARVAFGCLPTVAMSCLAQVMPRFHRDFPETSVRVFDNSATEIAKLVQTGAAAFGITVAAANPWDLETRLLAREPFVLLCRKDMPVARKPAFGWSALAGLPLVRIAAETGNRILIDDALGARRDTLNWRYEVQRITTAASLVQSGMACVVTPRLAVDVVGDPDLVAVRLREPEVQRSLVALTRRGLPLEPAAEQLIELFREALAQRLSVPSRRRTRDAESS